MSDLQEQQRKARLVYWAARRHGELVLKDACEECGRKPPEVQRLDGHHHNGYGPGHELDVITLCRSCHARVHPGQDRAEAGRKGAHASARLANTTPERRTEIARQGGRASVAALTPEQFKTRSSNGGRKGNCIRHHGRECGCWMGETPDVTASA